MTLPPPLPPLPMTTPTTPPTPSPERLTFDSEALPPAERMDRYRALYSIGADVIQTGPAPRMTFEAWRLDRAILYDRRLNDVSHRRDAQRTERDGFTHWTATLVFEGRVAFDPGDGIVRHLTPGQVILADVNRGGRTEAHHAWIATLSIAQERLEAVVGPIAALHGIVLAAADCRLYADFVRSLLANLPTMKTPSLAAATSAMSTLLKVALEAHGWRDAVTETGREGRRLTQLRVLVDARLGDPDFDTETAIAESGVSRATLYRLLQPQHGLAAFIQARRLERVRQALSDPGDHRGFAEIAIDSGFTSEGHASRVFLKRYGIRPSGYRATVAAPPSQSDPIAQFRLWQEELR